MFLIGFYFCGTQIPVEANSLYIHTPMVLILTCISGIVGMLYV